MKSLGDRAGVSHARIVQLEKGDSTTRDMVQRLAKALVSDGLDEDEQHAAYDKILNEGLKAAGFASEGEIVAELDPDLQMIVEGWEGMSPTGRRAIKSAAELALEMSREGSIGGKRAE